MPLLYAGLLLLLVFLPAVAGLPGNAEGGGCAVAVRFRKIRLIGGGLRFENTDDAGQENREDEDVFRLLDTSTGRSLTVKRAGIPLWRDCTRRCLCFMSLKRLRPKGRRLYLLQPPTGTAACKSGRGFKGRRFLR